MRYASLYNKTVPQTEQLNERQVRNNAGGFVFAVDNWTRLNRFLILGSDTNTYYQKASQLTRENAKCVDACYDENPIKTVDAIVSVSQEGRAPKNDPAIFALALGVARVGDKKARQAALGALPAVCRTATHLFQFLEATKALNVGWGRSFKRAVAKWYNDKEVSDVAFQMVKYRERNGWSHKDTLRLAHPDAHKLDRRSLYQWARGVEHNPVKLPKIVHAFESVQDPDLSKKTKLALIQAERLPWEALPTECNSDPDYWEAQLPTMGLTALVRNLGNMSRIGLIKPLSAAEKLVAERLSDEQVIRKSRLHPFNILVALKTFESGHGFRGTNTWDVSQPICAALDQAFYKAFKNVEPTGKRFFFGLDVSGSMTSKMQNTNVSCAEATAALSLVSLNVEPQTYVMGFANTFRDLGIRKGDTLTAAAKKAHDNNFGSTDCSLPMTYALSKQIPVDVFVILTDNETYAGRVHPSAALQDYRNKMKINSKLIVVGMTATNFSIADPNDAGMMDVAGFDTSVPAVMAEFARR